MKTVVFNPGVTALGIHAFQGCESIESIELPDGLECINQAAFCECTNLKQVAIPESVTSIELRAFYQCQNLVSVNLPSGLKKLCKQVFAHCESLPSMKIPEQVSEIENGVFAGCLSLSSLSLPESVSKIGSQIVLNCPSLTDLYVYNPTPVTIDEETFNELIYPVVTLHIPSGSLDAYMSATYWKDFTNIKDDLQHTGISTVVNDSATDAIYDLQGHRMDSLRPGLNIIKTKNGRTRKVIF